nr:hypothetical protein CFP56_40471 [Quercus suber]
MGWPFFTNDIGLNDRRKLGMKGYLLEILKNEARQRGFCRRRAESLEPFNNGSGDLVFQAKVWHTPVNEPEKVQAAKAMVQRRDVQLSDYFSGAQVLVGRASPPRLEMVAPVYRRKRPLVESSRGQAGAQPVGRNASTILVIANPLVS